ncbi:hypothetical protein E2562_005596 [Oryza meyeriana var. granulata]|uniref:Uncharacterized protein n=1 Tax=Oryza meyeriana var. granulata TaxID=110450 RepID=A0A6G1F3Z9_9ORYZ|nr:hypothetical protein E2562_005596 [Oryza meyeriana var. granulata]
MFQHSSAGVVVAATFLISSQLQQRESHQDLLPLLRWLAAASGVFVRPSSSFFVFLVLCSAAACSIIC